MVISHTAKAQAMFSYKISFILVTFGFKKFTRSNKVVIFFTAFAELRFIINRNIF